MKIISTSAAIIAAAVAFSTLAHAESPVLEQQYKLQRTLDGAKNVQTQRAFASQTKKTYTSNKKTNSKAISSSIETGPQRALRRLRQTQPTPSGAR